ncbi:helix-turn-helix domain-containing protein [Flindersiella endophytica]
MSARHISLVETGKTRPGAEMVLRLAEKLDVPLRDRNQPLLAAGFAPRYAELPLDGAALAAAKEANTRVLHAHEPYPAIVLDRRWNVVLANRAAGPFFASAAPDLLRPPVNLVRVGLDPRGLRAARRQPRRDPDGVPPRPPPRSLLRSTSRWPSSPSRRTTRPTTRPLPSSPVRRTPYDRPPSAVSARWISTSVPVKTSPA